MNRNHLKLIACLSMVIDHIGHIMFPDIIALRVIGRIAMPVFAFFIGEGCLHTRDRKKYFLRIFVLALICQAVNMAESFINDSGRAFYLNILFTFSFSVILCGLFLHCRKNPSAKNKALLIVAFAGFFLMDMFFEGSGELIGVNITLDYGFPGVCLPLFAVLFEDRKKKLLCFTGGLLLFSLVKYDFYMPFFIFAMLSGVLLCFYNGKGGKMNLKYFFYLFYPLHLAAIYLAEMLIH